MSKKVKAHVNVKHLYRADFEVEVPDDIEEEDIYDLLVDESRSIPSCLWDHYETADREITWKEEPGGAPEDGATTQEYAVTLLYPDYLADQYGEDTYTDIIVAGSGAEAASLVQRAAAKSNEMESPLDFRIVSVVGFDDGELYFI